MLVREIEKSLDMRLILKVKQQTELFKATLDLKSKIPVFIYGKDGHVWLSTYFSKEAVGRNTDILLNRFKGIKLENSYVVDTQINNVKDFAIIRKLADLPSLVINRSDMSNGALNIYARFHSSQSDQVSKLIAEYMVDKENSRIDWLGPSPGIIKIMDIINSEYPLSLVTYEIPLNGMKEEFGNLLASELILEPTNNQIEKEAFSMVLYSKDMIHGSMEGLTPISNEDHIYSLKVSNFFLNEVRAAANEHHIMRTRYFIKPTHDRLQITVFIPTANIYEYCSILFDIARKTENQLKVKYLLPYTQDVWDII